MNLTTTPLSTLLAPKGNPRRTLDTGLTAGLAKSIRTDGLLQNLVVAPEGEGKYRVISGKRRYLALQLLKKEGAIDGDYQVPVDIKDDLADEDAFRLATVENVQREQLHPMDEADAYAELLQSGGTVEAITEKTGLTERLVKTPARPRDAHSRREESAAQRRDRPESGRGLDARLRGSNNGPSCGRSIPMVRPIRWTSARCSSNGSPLCRSRSFRVPNMPAR